VVIFEAQDLRPGNKLRSLAAKSPNAALLACYPDGAQDLDRLAGEALREAGLNIDHGARAALVARMGPDRQANRQMLETLITYRLGAEGPVTEADVDAALGDLSAVGFDAIAFAAFEGRTAEALSLFDKSVAEKTDPEQIMASLFRHLDRFDLWAAFDETGKGPEAAMKALRLGPKQRQSAFRQQTGRWPRGRLAAARRLAVDAQIEMRTGGAGADLSALICRNLILRIGTAAGRR
jgi:DNA polymerase-3 subunit delta